MFMLTIILQTPPSLWVPIIDMVFIFCAWEAEIVGLELKRRVA